MPHIIVYGCDLDRVIKQINIHVRVDFETGFYKQSPAKAQQKLDAIQDKLAALIDEYFPNNYQADNWLYNHSFNADNGQTFVQTEILNDPAKPKKLHGKDSRP